MHDCGSDHNRGSQGRLLHGTVAGPVMPRSRENPKILWVDDSEVVRDSVAVGVPIPRHVVAQEGQHCDAEIPEASEPLAEIRKRRIFCPLTETSGGVDVKSVAEQSEDAVGGEDSDTEHQMAEGLEMAADPQVAATELILDAGIGTFGRASLVIGQVPGIGDFDQPAPRALGGDFGLERGIAAGGAVDRRNPAGGEAFIDDRLGVVWGIHEVVEPHDALFAGPGERDGDLAVMGGSGGEDRGDGTMPLAVSRCSLSPIQVSLTPLLLRLTPTSHWVGNPADSVAKSVFAVIPQ